MAIRKTSTESISKNAAESPMLSTRRSKGVARKDDYRLVGHADREAVLALLQSWCDASEDEAREQQETGAYLVQALDEDRLEGARHFP